MLRKLLSFVTFRVSFQMCNFHINYVQVTYSKYCFRFTLKSCFFFEYRKFCWTFILFLFSFCFYVFMFSTKKGKENKMIKTFVMSNSSVLVLLLTMIMRTRPLELLITHANAVVIVGFIDYLITYDIWIFIAYFHPISWHCP